MLLYAVIRPLSEELRREEVEEVRSFAGNCMVFLKMVYEIRKRYFECFDSYLQEIKEIVQRECPDAGLYLFDSMVKDEYYIGLSDIDVAVVSGRFKDKDKKLEVFGELSRTFFDSPFEFHVLTEEQWEFFKNFVRKYTKI